MTAPIGAPQIAVIRPPPAAGNPSKPKSEFCIICRITAPCTSEARNTHKSAVVSLALGDWASLAKVCSLGRVSASLQTENHSETPEGGGSIGALVGSFISSSKWLVFSLLHEIRSI